MLNWVLYDVKVNSWVYNKCFGKTLNTTSAITMLMTYDSSCNNYRQDELLLWSSFCIVSYIMFQILQSISSFLQKFAQTFLLILYNFFHYILINFLLYFITQFYIFDFYYDAFLIFLETVWYTIYQNNTKKTMCMQTEPIN